jgi:hypothetical protein
VKIKTPTKSIITILNFLSLCKRFFAFLSWSVALPILVIAGILWICFEANQN